MAKAKNHEQYARALEASEDYRVLRRLQPRDRHHEPDGTPTKLAVFLDLETTGFDPEVHDVIELAMVPFEYAADGRIFRVHEPFNQLQEPEEGGIPDAITRLTGITNDMVGGRRIDAVRVAEIAATADLIVAHNARFDRGFAEMNFDGFADKPWACSMSQIPWREEGYDGAKLAYLATKSGFFYDAHRATIDCQAGIELLARPLIGSGRPALQVLLEAANAITIRIWADSAPYGAKDTLKARGYRWNDGGNGKPKAWYVDVEERLLEAETGYLRDEIFGEIVDLPTAKCTAVNRFSDRI
jgi:DNA polymerase III subunit epsilon